MVRNLIGFERSQIQIYLISKPSECGFFRFSCTYSLFWKYRKMKIKQDWIWIPGSVLFYTHQYLKKGKDFRKNALNHTHHSLHSHHRSNRCQRLQLKILLLLSLLIVVMSFILLHDLLIYIHQLFGQDLTPFSNGSRGCQKVNEPVSYFFCINYRYPPRSFTLNNFDKDREVF